MDSIRIYDDQVVFFNVKNINGYHRPINDEVANITVTIDADDISYFLIPPLGANAVVIHNNARLFNGVINSVVFSDNEVKLNLIG
jgi:hypothetical protein